MTLNAYMMLWAPWVLAIVLGQWVARRAEGTWPAVFKAALSGLLMLFAAIYVLDFLWDLHFWQKYFPNSTAIHEFGPDWPNNLLRSTLVTFQRTAIAYGVVFAGVVAWRTQMNKSDAGQS